MDILKQTKKKSVEVAEEPAREGEESGKDSEEESEESFFFNLYCKVILRKVLTVS